jgi:hypothetical protein
MARTTKTEPTVETNGDDEDVTRISITIDPALRRKLRIASAFADLTPGEFAVKVINAAADRALQEAGVDK